MGRINGLQFRLDRKNGAFLFITFTTVKGILNEMLMLKFKDDKVYQAYQIRDISSAVLYTFVEPGYPLDSEEDYMVKEWKKHKPVEKMEKKIVTEDSVYIER